MFCHGQWPCKQNALVKMLGSLVKWCWVEFLFSVGGLNLVVSDSVFDSGEMRPEMNWDSFSWGGVEAK